MRDESPRPLSSQFLTVEPNDEITFVTRLWVLILSACLASPVVRAESAKQQQAKSIFGWVERVSLELDDASIELKAKLDTGAKSSSLHAKNVRNFKCDCDDGDYVLFDVSEVDGTVHTVKRKVERYVKIKRHKRAFDRRPTVMMRVCMGAVSKKIEVNLVDRNRFLYPLLLGRTALIDDAIVDPGRTFLNQASCQNFE